MANASNLHHVANYAYIPVTPHISHFVIGMLNSIFAEIAKGHNRMKLGLAFACAMLAASGAADAQLAGNQVNGSVTFNGGTTNFFDPANHFVPAGYGNSTGLPVTIGSETEFAIGATQNLDTADFSDTQLTITDNVLSTGSNAAFEMQFTSLTPGLFEILTLDSNNFTGLTYGLSGDTITIDWTGGAVEQGQVFQAVFNLIPGAVPEPSTWATMLLGFAAVGIAIRHKRRSSAAIA